MAMFTFLYFQFSQDKKQLEQNYSLDSLPKIDSKLKRTIASVQGDSCLDPQHSCKELYHLCHFDKDCCSFNCLNNECRLSNSTKQKIGQQCKFNSDCFSDKCGRDDLCIGTKKYPARVGQYCDSDSQCKSKKCVLDLNICVGSEDDPAGVGQYCAFPYECKSENCSLKYNICLGSKKDSAEKNQICLQQRECKSGICRLSNHRCR